MEGRADVDKIMGEIGPHLQPDTAGDARHYNRVYELIMRILDKYEGTRLTWYPFDPAKGSRQHLPPLKKYVLVQIKHPQREHGAPDPVVVGYMKNAAGDKQSPYFVTPGATIEHGYTEPGRVIGWCDCLPESFIWPKEE